MWGRGGGDRNPPLPGMESHGWNPGAGETAGGSVGLLAIQLSLAYSET